MKTKTAPVDMIVVRLMKSVKAVFQEHIYMIFYGVIFFNPGPLLIYLSSMITDNGAFHLSKF